MKKICVYPFCLSSAFLARNLNIVNGYEICRLISFLNWGLCGRDAGEVDGGKKVGIVVEDQFLPAIEACDALLICDSILNNKIENDIMDKVNTAIRLKKKILTSHENNNLNLSIKRVCPSDLWVEYNKNESPFLFKSRAVSPRLGAIPVPVVTIGGLTEDIDKFHIQLQIRSWFQNKGYRVSQVGTKRRCEVFGFHSYPEELYCNNLSFSEKIIYFNRFCQRIVVKENADILILGLPGAMLSYNNTFTELFGEFSVIITKAVACDAGIICIPYGEYAEDAFEELKIGTHYKFGIDVVEILISNAQIDLNRSREAGRLVLTRKTILEKQDSFNFTLSDNTISNCCQALFQRLSENAFGSPIELGSEIE